MRDIKLFYAGHIANSLRKTVAAVKIRSESQYILPAESFYMIHMRINVPEIRCFLTAEKRGVHIDSHKAVFFNQPLNCAVL